MASDLVLDGPVASAKNTAWWLYIIHAVSFVHSHHSWQIRSFWWYLVWMFIGGVLWFTIIGIPLAILVWCAAWLWKAYRLVKGIVDLNENRAMP
jgi:uncharacterized membrane protein